VPIVPTAVGYVFYKNSSLCSAIHVTCVSSSYVVRHVLIGQCDRKCHFMSSPVVKVARSSRGAHGTEASMGGEFGTFYA